MASATCKRVVEVDLRLKPVVTGRRQRGPVLGPQFTRVNVEFNGRRDCEGFGDSTQGHLSREQFRAERERRLDLKADEKHVR